MASLWPLLVFIVGIIASATSTPYYSVVAPQVVRPNSAYHVAISTTGTSKPSIVRIELSANLYNKGGYNVSQTTTVRANTTCLVKLHTGNATSGRYWLTVQGVSGIQFYNKTELQFVPNSHTVFIQTDRATYKPGTQVLWRAVVLDSNLLPAPEGTKLDAYITDGQGNRLKQWTQQIVSRGVFSADIQLADHPILGTWTIVVDVFELEVVKSFEVAEYVLPKYEVTIIPPTDATFSDIVLPVTVTARYTYGKDVQGTATITAFPNTYILVGGNYRLHPGVQKVVPINGNVTVEFNIESELGLQNTYTQYIGLEASVEETLTGRVENASSNVVIYTEKFTIQLIQTADDYKPGLKYTVFVKIAQHDGTPVKNECEPVEIWYGFTYNKTLYTHTFAMLDDNGMVRLDFYPLLNTNGTLPTLNIEVEYLGVHEVFGGISQSVSPSSTYIQATLKTENPMVNKYIQIEVTSTIHMKYFNWEVLGRGDILAAATVQVSNKKTATFRFLATYLMAPNARVVVYFIRCDGEVVAGALDLQLNGTLANFVDVGISPPETKPGGSVDLTVTSQSNSWVGLLGVDQSSILLRSGNDITHEQVANALSYGSNNQFGLGASTSGGLFWNPGSSDAFDVFSESNLVFLSNGFLYQNQQFVFFGFGGFRGGGGGGGVSFASDSAGSGSGSAGGGGAVADSSSVQSASIRVRTNFPETWIWEMVDAGSTGKTALQRIAPDTITTFVLTAFSVHPTFGFGLIDQPSKLIVFQPFFISLNLPYSVIRGEIVAISIIVFNYMSQDVNADVTLTNDGQFDFAEASTGLQNNSTQAVNRTKTILVKALSGAAVSFMITPKNVGTINITVTATSALAGDSIIQPLVVKPEGQTQYRNKGFFIELRTANSFAATVEIDIPNNRVPGSEIIQISAIGNILGPMLSNLANLLRMPYGCGEQNMISLVIDIIVINYLKSINQLTPEILAEAVNFIEVGYQRELAYRHTDGSFSAFGNSDINGSTWLTAYVSQWFVQATAFITIEDRIIRGALQWLANVQTPEGNFPEVGTVIRRDMQKGEPKGLALTAFSLISFLRNETYVSAYNSTVTKGLAYIAQNLANLTDVYALCISTYVLNLAKHPSADTAFKMMQALGQDEGGLLWWSKPIPLDDKNPWRFFPRSANVEMTAYAMLTYLLRNMDAESVPIMKWLITQRNSYGGFASTQDTVVATVALTELGKRLATGNGSTSITFTYGNGGTGSFDTITAENDLVLQQRDLPVDTREVNITAVGNGFALVQVSYSYNLNLTGDFPLFKLRVQVDNSSDADHLQLNICTAFIPNNGDDESNMAVMEVNFPSGFVSDPDFLAALQSTPHVQRVETKDGDTVVVLYFDKLVKDEYCVTVHAYRLVKVAKLAIIPVTIYDYYDSTRRATVFYLPLIVTLCDLCQNEDCGDTCRVG